MRAAVWHQQNILVVKVDAITDTFDKMLLESIGAKLYGRRDNRKGYNGKQKY